jgi:hypothetical protein
MGGRAPLDQHEFNIVNNGASALVTIYELVQYNMSRFGGPSDGFLLSGVFQDIDLATGRLLFDWGSIEHVDPSYSFVNPNDTKNSGDGHSPLNPWDYL